jgi:hypothetical protein
VKKWALRVKKVSGKVRVLAIKLAAPDPKEDLDRYLAGIKCGCVLHLDDE